MDASSETGAHAAAQEIQHRQSAGDDEGMNGSREAHPDAVQ